MATDKSQEWQEAADPAESEWRGEVEAEVMIKLEREGEGWTGRFVGMDPPNRTGIIQAHFENAESLTGMYIGDAFVNAGRDLERKLRKVPEKSFVRCEWVSSMETGQVTPMRVFRVQWR